MDRLDIIDKILEKLKSIELSMSDVYEITQLKQDKLTNLLKLLKEVGFIEIKDNRISITKMGLQFLKLPEG